MLALKQHYNQEFFHLVSAIKKSMVKKSEILFFKKIGNHNKILQLLLDEGFIVAFQDYKTFLVIRIKMTSNKTISTFKSVQRLNRKNFTVSLKELVSLQRQEGPSSQLILNTEQGLLTSCAAIEKGVGGKLLFKIS